MMETVPTPPIRAIWLLTPSSRILFKPGILSSAVAEIRRIGISSAPNLKIIGVLASSGRVLFTSSNLSLTSLVATSISIPYSNVRVITEEFSFELDVMCLRLLTPFKVFSSGLVTLFSISDALAPE